LGLVCVTRVSLSQDTPTRTDPCRRFNAPGLSPARGRGGARCFDSPSGSRSPRVSFGALSTTFLNARFRASPPHFSGVREHNFTPLALPPCNRAGISPRYARYFFFPLFFFWELMYTWPCSLLKSMACLAKLLSLPFIIVPSVPSPILLLFHLHGVP